MKGVVLGCGMGTRGNFSDQAHGQKQPCCPLLKEQTVVEGQLLSDDASLEARCKKRETTK